MDTVQTCNLLVLDLNLCYLSPILRIRLIFLTLPIMMPGWYRETGQDCLLSNSYLFTIHELLITTLFNLRHSIVK